MYTTAGDLKCSKATYAQCCHVLEHKATLEELLKSVQPLIQAKNKGLLYVLVYELLLGPNKRIRGGGAVKRQLMAQKTALEGRLKEIVDAGSFPLQSFKKAGCNGTTNKAATIIPRYLRINTLVADPVDILEKLREKISSIYMDPHVPNLLVVEPTPENRALLQEFVSSHQVILQDKSSCFSALCLVHGYDDDDDGVSIHNRDFLDACAAPGNKTSHLAALLQERTEEMKKSKNKCGNNIHSPIIHAFDKSPQRFAMLKRRLTDLAPNDSVKCYHLDFLEASGNERDMKKKRNPNKASKTNCSDTNAFQNVGSILLDPSCSGSGMTSNHTEHSLNRDPYYADERIRSLSDFQFLALKHATTNFPLVNRVVYSTCSRYYQENEGVIKRVLDVTAGEWNLVEPQCLKGWHRRGMLPKDVSEGLSMEEMKCVIRVDPELDATNGFFVACLERNPSTPKKQKTAASSWKSPADLLPSGMELYSDQFSGKLEPPHNQRSVDDSKKRTLDQIVKDSDSDPISHSKKRSKKLEWKRQQKLKKEERLRQKKATEA